MSFMGGSCIYCEGEHVVKNGKQNKPELRLHSLLDADRHDHLQGRAEMKLGGVSDLQIKAKEKVTRIKAA